MKNNIKIDDNLKKILIIGANGFLGSEILNLHDLKENLTQKPFFIAADVKNDNVRKDIPFYRMDITDPVDISASVESISPDIIILTAAMTHVDQCEINKELASKINVEGPKHIIEICKKTNCMLVFISSDFIFEGIKEEGSLYSEKDIPNPLNHYAKTKYEAEKLILNSGIEHLICRTAVLYGWNKYKLNFVTWILKNLKQGNEISIVKDQINSPTFARNLGEIILKLIEKGARGIFHTAGENALSRYEMAIQCAKKFGYDKDLIVKIESLEQIATRPKNVGLDISKLKNYIGNELKICNFEQGLNYMKDHLV